MRSGLERLNLLDGQLVVAIDLDLRAQFAQVLDKVVGERIVVVEDENHQALSMDCIYAPCIFCLKVSSMNSAGRIICKVTCTII